jgi:hypothetical protein
MQEKKINSFMKAGYCTLGLAASLIRLTAGGVAIACVYTLIKKHGKGRKARLPAKLQSHGFSNRV